MRKNYITSLMIASLFAISCCGFYSSPSYAKEQIYEAKAPGKHGDVAVNVTFDKDKIKSIEIVEHHETKGISDSAISKIPQRIIESQSINVDAISGATITSRAIINAVEKTILKAGLNVSDFNVESKKVQSIKTVFEKTDIVVIGAGASGTAAALAARQNGANVILLEKTPVQMGAGTLAGGMFAADSQQQIDRNKTVDKKWLYDQYMNISSGFINSELVRTIIDESGKTVDWLNENGAIMKLADAGSGGGFEHQGGPATLHGYQEGGTVALKNLLQNFVKAGGKAYFSTPAKEFIFDSNNKITGVIAENDKGELLNISTKAIIVATGGFGGNAKMLEKFIGVPFTMGEISQNKGDGIKMAWKAGAAERGVNVTQYFWAKFNDDEMEKIVPIIGEKWDALTNFTRYPNLRVNLKGKRFGDETNVTLYSVHGAQLHMQPQETEFVIIDTDILNEINERGTIAIEEQYSKWKGNRQFFMEFNEPNDTDEFIKQENTPYDYTKILDPLVGKTETVFKADSIEDLGVAIGVNPEQFKSSVKQYNAAIETGKDTLYFGDTKRFVRISTPPFYAVKFVARNLGTLGGVRINNKIEAVDESDNPIKGLYVSGSDAGGMYGKAYVDFEGGTLGFAYISGRLAGINASNYVSTIK